MSQTMRSMVETYVRYGNRQALDDLRSTRRGLIADLKKLGNRYDPSKVVAVLEDEIAIIEAGVARLNSAAAA